MNGNEVQAVLGECEYVNGYLIMYMFFSFFFPFNSNSEMIAILDYS